MLDGLWIVCTVPRSTSANGTALHGAREGTSRLYSREMLDCALRTRFGENALETENLVWVIVVCSYSYVAHCFKRTLLGFNICRWSTQNEARNANRNEVVAEDARNKTTQHEVAKREVNLLCESCWIWQLVHGRGMTTWPSLAFKENE